MTRRPLTVSGRISIARTHRGSVMPVSTTALHHLSCACGSTVNFGDLMVRSGAPLNRSAKFHTATSGHCFGGGMSFGSPFGAPAVTHRRIVSICASLRERSFSNFWIPTCLSRCHGGISRAATRAAIERTQTCGFVGHKRHRRHRVRPVTRSALLSENGRNVRVYVGADGAATVDPQQALRQRPRRAVQSTAGSLCCASPTPSHDFTAVCRR
jgi:hypothetical protein